MKKVKSSLVCLLSLFIFLVGINFRVEALSSDIPQKPTQNIFVQDYANIIDENSKNQLLQMSENARNNGTTELAIVTIPSLNGDDIKEYANTLFRTWGIGNKETNNGLLVLIVNDTRQTRIEVGKGLEGAITDAKAGDVIRIMAPHFKDGKFGEGLIVGHQSLMNMVSTENITNGQSEKNTIADTTNTSSDDSVIFLLSIFVIGVIVIYLAKVFLFGKSDSFSFNTNDDVFFPEKNKIKREKKEKKESFNYPKDTNTISVNLEKEKSHVVLSQPYAEKKSEYKEPVKTHSSLYNDDYYSIRSSRKTSNANTTSKTSTSSQSASKPKAQTVNKPKVSTNNGYNNNSYYDTPSYTPSYETKRNDDDYSSSYSDFGSGSSDFGGGSSDGGGADGGW